MKKLFTKKTVVIASFVLVAGFIASQAFGHMGSYNNMMGYNGHMNGYNQNMMSYGQGMMGNGGGHMWDNLSVEDQKKMQDQMNTFFEATKEIREQAYEKRQELKLEFSKSEKDQGKIDTLQKELYEISSQFEKKRFNQMTEMQKLFSDKNGGSFMGNGRNYGGGC